MGKIINFSINLDQSQLVYYAGQWVSGNVVLHLGEEMKMRGIHLTLFGGARVHWTEQHQVHHGKEHRTETRHYWNDETYYNNKLYLYGNTGGAFSNSTVVSAGHYVYPFQMQLPPSLPSSFEGDHGHVRYHIKCVIDRPWKFDHQTKRIFSVISLLDLNQLPDVMHSPEGRNSKTLCCLCCASGPIESTARLDRRGYVPGEDVIVNALVSNDSSRRMSGTSAELCMVIRFHAHTKTTTSTRKVAIQKMGEIPPGGDQAWSNVRLHIPPLPPSNLIGCRIIDIEYIVKFVVDPSGPALDLEIPMPITIGSIPLRTHFDSYNANATAAGIAYGPAGQQFAPPAEPAKPPPMGFVDPSLPGPGSYMPPQPMAPSAPHLMPPVNLPNVPPPNYFQSVFGQTEAKDEGDNEYTMGDRTFAPTYTYYNWNNQQYSLPQ